MDNSKEYIKMCEKAGEIQGIELYMNLGDYFCSKNDEDREVKILDTPYDHTIFPEDFLDKIIWLPRQDQLQEMMRPQENRIWRLHEWFDSWYPLGDKTDSFEKLWLMFVMKEKYNKVWNGSEWK